MVTRERRKQASSARAPAASSRLSMRTTALMLVLLAGALWQVLPHSSTSPADFQEPSDEAGPRSLSTSCDGGEDVKLLMVYKGHLTTDCLVRNGTCLQKGKEGLIVLYILGMLYMFVALAIVCDEFFVPALEVFVDEFNISMDVAGATFMAAGGSMPELFTSFIGTFQKNDLGMATIVGSAVFNVLFVIAVCAVFSPTVLELTWWPMFRDCTYYTFCLGTLALFFIGVTPKKIEAWEAVVLLLEYILYCIYMKHNEKVYNFLMRLIHGPQTKIQILEDGKPLSDAREDGEPGEMHGKVKASILKPSTFRTGIVHLLVQNEDICDTVGIAAVSHIRGSLKETFTKLDSEEKGYISAKDLKPLLEELGLQADSKYVDQAFNNISRSRDGKITFEDFKRWYLASEARVEIKMQQVFRKFDTNNNGLIEREEIAAILKSLGHAATEEDVTEAIKEMMHYEPAADPPEAPEVTGVDCADKIEDLDRGRASPGQSPSAQRAFRASVHITYDGFADWYAKSLFFTNAKRECEKECEADNNAFTIDLPPSCSASGKFWYFLTYPICAALFVSMPDVRREGQANVKTACIEFALALFWIGIFSLCLVDWVTVVSNTIGVPESVAGLTVLAGGTSIPDLLSSYIVARNGEGDMAVSSSIGSNIFDVTVGLPLPWLAYNIIMGEHVSVQTESLGFSLLVLIAMLLAVVGTIASLGWRMTQMVGYVMFVLYVIFVLQMLLQTMPERDPAVPPVQF